MTNIRSTAVLAATEAVLEAIVRPDLTVTEGLGALASVAGLILAQFDSDKRDAAELMFASAVGAAVRAPISDAIGEPVGCA